MANFFSSVLVPKGASEREPCAHHYNWSVHEGGEMPAKRRWMDTHIHVSAQGPGGQRRERLLEDLVDVLDRSGADLRFVISCDLPEIRQMMRHPAQILTANQNIHHLVQGAPGRLYGACTVNPHFLDESLRTMDRCFGEWGFVLLGEMLPYIMDYEMNSAPVERIVRHAVDYGVPVQVHLSTSNRGQGPSCGIRQLEDLSPLAERVPEARYILAHAVGEKDDNPPIVDLYLDFIEQRFGSWPSNFWMEIRDVHSPGVRSAFKRVPCDRLLIGTDWTTRFGPPFLDYGVIFGVRPEENPYPPTIENMVALLKQAGADEATIERVAYRNAEALLLRRNPG